MYIYTYIHICNVINCTCVYQQCHTLQPRNAIHSKHTATHYNTVQLHVLFMSYSATAQCSTLHTHCNTLHHTATHCTTLQHTATHFDIMYIHCTTLHHTATHCATLQHTAPHCNTPHHTATHFDIMYIHCNCKSRHTYMGPNNVVWPTHLCQELHLLYIYIICCIYT